MTDDLGGTTNQPISISITGVVDPVSVPVLTTDSGVSGDNITNVANPSFSGTADSGADVELQIESAGTPNNAIEKFILVALANSVGAWDRTLGDDVSLSDGSYSVTATSTMDGETATSAQLLITVDTETPTITITSDDTALSLIHI